MNFIKFLLTGSVFLLPLFISAQTELWSSNRPDGHAPIGVMGDHMHKKGELMFGYRFGIMEMDQLNQDSESISSEEVLEDYMVSPISSNANMHTFGVMYAPSDFVTVTLMGGYISKEGEMVNRMGQQINVASTGFIDPKVNFIFRVMDNNKQHIHANLGVSLPLASIEQRDDTPMAEQSLLAYPMQIGSGTTDPVIGFTYLGQQKDLSWGGQSSYTARLYDNSRDYRLGNELKMTGWFAYRISQSFSSSVRLSYLNTQSISGADDEMNPVMMPMFDVENSGKDQVMTGIGLNYYVSSGDLKNIRIGAEYIIPLYQHVNGIQMVMGQKIVVGIQYSL
ncbi:hypothetical protein OO013_06915 [Mangrovivirga sp. M17]|uniref:Transporter n=1 Tax=Mangrovivirga halotolerans TaxID=2993936 RepID=A0ABT3RP63_9BACT|nr:hypothetical protein [Mangrovivirga halotolerans]MCX2743588.1 hypothetical protein [Mangrovivirga halotolerans]